MILDRESMKNHKHVEKQKILVVLHLTTGEFMFGFVHAAQTERISDVLNDQRGFLPFEDVDGERMIHAKTSIMRVYEICNVTLHFHHPDPYVVLGVSRGDSWDTVQHAYRQHIELYHPDRYARRNPPEAVLKLLDRMAGRLGEVLEQIRPHYISNAA